MSRMKSLFAILCVIAMGTLAAFATTPTCDSVGQAALDVPTVKVMIAGSSAMYTSLALGAYNANKGVSGAVPPMSHYSSTTKFNANDTRGCDPTWIAAGKTTSANCKVSDTGTTWVVWDSATKTVSYNTGTATAKCVAQTPNVWAFTSLDSVVGNRAFFAGVRVTAPTGYAWGDGDGINCLLWGDTTSACVGNHNNATVPAYVQNLFASTGTGVLVNVAATDIRPEDALFATARANSLRGKDATSTAPGNYDGLDGLGYGINPAGSLPAQCSGGAGTQQATWEQLVGTSLIDDYNASSFKVRAFNLFGTDPFTCAPVPAFKTIAVGASPIVFVNSRRGALANLEDAEIGDLQRVFSGERINASAFGLNPGPIAAYLREPLSGTMNTVEATTFRHPSSQAIHRFSQELGLDPTAGCNPLAACAAAGDITGGHRYRAIGTGNEMKSVYDGFANHGMDGIGYTFFSYGNVNQSGKALGANPNYGYITLNGVDPIFHTYGSSYDPGQPADFAGEVPTTGPSNAICGGLFPCDEGKIWAADYNFTRTDGTASGLSYPNVRNGSYPAWSLLRLVAATAKDTQAVPQVAYSNASTLVATSNQYVVGTVPDYIPFNPVKCTAAPVSAVNWYCPQPVKGVPGSGSLNVVYDPGLQLVRSHFGCPSKAILASAATPLQIAMCNVNPLSQKVLVANNSTDTGRDAGGSILPTKTTSNLGLTQDNNWGYVPFQP